MINTTTTSSESSEFIPEFGYGGFWRRYFANLVDGFVIGLLASSISYGFTVSAGKTTTSSSAIPSFLIGMAYAVFFWVTQNGQTLGKRAMGVKVVKSDGGPIDLSTGIVRYLGYILSSFLMLGYISAAFDQRKRAWHDKIANTLVVRIDNNSRNGRMVLLSILSFIVPIIFLVSLAAIGFFAAKYSTKIDGSNNQLTQQLSHIIPTRTISEVGDIENDVFSSVNSYRQSHQLPTLITDSHLCAYAQRRLEQVKPLAKYDDAKGLYEDMANPTMNKAYFLGYKTIAENYHGINTLSVSKDVVDSWTSAAKSNLDISDYSYGCVRSDGNTIFLVMGQKSK